MILPSNRPDLLWREGRTGTPLPAAARTECAPYQPEQWHYS